jgi:hypothetical protein
VKNEGLAHQVEAGMEGVDAWWFDVLSRGYVFESPKPTVFPELTRWHEVLPKAMVRASLTEWRRANSRKAGPDVSEKALGQFFLKELGHTTTRRDTKGGEHP